MIVWSSAAVVVAALAAWAVMQLKPASPTVDRSTIWTGTVERGDLTIQVRASTGMLVQREDAIKLISAQTDATVVRINALPGTRVGPNTVIMELSDPELNQKVLNARLALQAAEADYKSLQATLESALMDKRVAAAAVNADYSQDRLQAQTDKQLYQLGVISGLAYHKSQDTAEQLTIQRQISQEQIAVNQSAIQVQLASAQAKVDQAKAQFDLYEKQQAALHVTAGITGELAPLSSPLQVGEHVTAGTPLAEVIQLDKLKATLQIAETQAHDIQLGQLSLIDTHNGVVPGHVSRIDPAVLNGTRAVDVRLDGPLPPGAVPQLSVDGTINVAQLHNVLYVCRPALANESSTISLFKIDPDGKGATRVTVKVGYASANNIQVLSGLKEGDTVILSDMSRYDNVDHIRLN